MYAKIDGIIVKSIVKRSDENIQYADDCCLVYVGENLPELINHVNMKMKTILEWCNKNKLKINPMKSEVMVVTNKKIQIQPHIYLGDELIPIVDCVKYLGVFIDSHLNFNKQIENLQSRLSSVSGIAYRMNAKMNLRVSKNYY